MGQLQISVGGAGGVHWRAVQTVNVAQELSWMGIRGKAQGQVARQYRQIEQEALILLNEREAKAAKSS